MDLGRDLPERSYCPDCDAEVYLDIKEVYQDHKVKGISVRVVVEAAFCRECGNEIYIPKLNDDNVDLIAEEFRRVTGRIAKDEIKAILDKYNIGAKPLAALLGWGECTIVRYLKGHIPNVENSDRLKSLRNPYVFRDLYETHKETLTPAAQKKLEGALSGYIEVHLLDNPDSIFERSLVDYFTSFAPSIYNGFTHFTLKKLINAILYFANRYGGTYKTKMNKLLWYSDMLCYKRISHAITGLVYQRTTYGPVPKKYEWIYGSLVERYIDLRENEYGTQLISLKECNTNTFSSDELDVLFSVGEKFRDWYAGDLSNYSHRERGYLDTEDKGLIPFSFAKDLSLGAIRSPTSLSGGGVLPFRALRRDEANIRDTLDVLTGQSFSSNRPDQS
ncbi:MAG: DUF4065 domain-containing protein [Peptococcaceae bacterium]|jgi:hypothetical protein|nr:DUF4065 domain-containing protein [Peptococcaceae bacterium]